MRAVGYSACNSRKPSPRPQPASSTRASSGNGTSRFKPCRAPRGVGKNGASRHAFQRIQQRQRAQRQQPGPGGHVMSRSRQRQGQREAQRNEDPAPAGQWPRRPHGGQGPDHGAAQKRDDGRSSDVTKKGENGPGEGPGQQRRQRPRQHRSGALTAAAMDQYSRSLTRRRAIDWLCNWHTRDSVTLRTAAISFRFMSCS